LDNKFDEHALFFCRPLKWFILWEIVDNLIFGINRFLVLTSYNNWFHTTYTFISISEFLYSLFKNLFFLGIFDILNLVFSNKNRIILNSETRLFFRLS